MFTGVTIQVEAVERLSAHPNIVGMKESGSDIAYITELVLRTPDDFTMLAGSATTFFHALCAGCDGGILALAALLPDACVRMQSLVQEQRLAEARTLQHWLMPLARSVGSTYGVAGLKAALDLTGYNGGVPRPPLRPALPHVVETIRGQLAAFGAFKEILAGHTTGGPL
jgi:4-hydroxy-2-oxoglutarate aldolase